MNLYVASSHPFNVGDKSESPTKKSASSLKQYSNSKD